MWIALFAILLTASIAFHAPWKVLALCSILLLGALAVPRRPRRYFWASVGWITLAATVWVFLPDDPSGWRPYTFDAEAQAFLAKHHVPDTESAAVIYEDICRIWGPGDPNEPNVRVDWCDRARNGPWRSEDHPAVAAWLDYHGPTVNRLLEAAGREQCFFEDSIGDSLTPLDAEMPPIAQMRQLAYMLMVSANRDWGQRGLAASMEKQFAVLKLGAHLSSQPEVLFVLVGAAVETLAMEQYNRAMVQSDVDASYLDRVGRELAGVPSDWQSVVAAALDTEKLCMKNLVAAGFYQANETGRVRLTRGPYSQSGDLLTVHPTYWEERAGRAWVIMHWFFLPSNPAKVGAMIDEAYERHASLLSAGVEAFESHPSGASSLLNADWSRFRWNLGYFADVTASLGEDSHVALCMIYRMLETMRRGTLAVIALRRYKDDHGSWPTDLKAGEARRMIGSYVMTENDCLVRRQTPEPVGMGSYGMDSHNLQRYVTSDGFVQNEGDVGVSPPRAYQIAFGSLTPRQEECANLVVPVCVSSSHIAYGSIRMEPVFMILGQSAATAAAFAIDGDCPVQKVDYGKLRERLLADGQVLSH